MTKIEEIAFIVFFALALLLPLQAQAQAGSLVFSLKFSGDKLDLSSVSLVPGEPPDYKIEPSDDWLTVDFHGEGRQVHSIKVPDPRKLLLEVVEGKNITGVRVRDENAKLVFTAPNLPAASQAEIRDESGTRLLAVDYRRALQVREEAPPQPPTQFEPPHAQAPSLIPLAIVLALFAAALAYYATRKPGEPRVPPRPEIEKSVEELLKQSRLEQRERELRERLEKL